MEFSWEEYKKAKHIVTVFEKERKEIQLKRQSLKYPYWDRTLNNIIWHKRNELNKEMYGIRNATPEQIKAAGNQFLNDWINNLKSELLTIRKRVLLK